MDLPKLMANIEMLQKSITQSTRPESIYAKSMLAVAEVHCNLLIVAAELLTEIKKINEQTARVIELSLQREYPAPPATMPPVPAQYFCTKCKEPVTATVTEIGGDDHVIFQCSCSAVNEGQKLPDGWIDDEPGGYLGAGIGAAIDDPKAQGVMTDITEPGDEVEVEGYLVDSVIETNRRIVEDKVDTVDTDVSTSDVNQPEDDGLGEFEETKPKE